MGRPKNNSSPEGEQGITEENENAQDDEGQNDSLEQNTDEEQQGEGEGNTEISTDETSDVTIQVFSESRKGATIYAASGTPIVFDNEGKAMVNEVDALYLKQCPGFRVG
jgi:hypothetical protein